MAGQREGVLSPCRMDHMALLGKRGYLRERSECLRFVSLQCICVCMPLHRCVERREAKDDVRKARHAAAQTQLH